MTGRLRTALKVAAFAAVSLFLLGSLVLELGQIDLSDRYELTATFDDVQGLLEGDAVKLAGVPIGRVASIEPVDGRAVVRFEVDRDVELPTDSEASIRWRNLLGQRYLYVAPGTAGATLADGDEIGRTRSVVDLGELFNRLGPIVKALDPDQVNAFLDAFVGAIDGNEEKLSAAIHNLATLSSALADRDEAIARLVGNLDEVATALDHREADIRTVLDNLLAVSSTFAENTDVLNAAVTEIGDFSGHLSVLLEGNRDEIERILANLATLVKVVQSKLPELDSTVAGLDTIAQTLFNVSRYGEWLQQVIPCGRLGYPTGQSTACEPEFVHGAGAAGRSAAPPRGVTGTEGLRQILLGAAPALPAGGGA